MTRAVRWAVMGTGRIAEGVLPRIAAARNCIVTAIASRERDKAAALAARCGLLKDPDAAACDYEELLTRDDVDAVYITLINNLHYYWARRLLEAGKHVLCEKPLVATAQEAQDLAEIAASRGVVCCEGLMYMHHPQTARLVQLARSAHEPDSPIGPIKRYRSLRNVTNTDQYILNTRLSHAMQGGAVMDIGCYPISIALLVSDEEPISQSIRATAEFAPLRPGETGRVDETCDFSWTFPSGATFEGGCSFNRPHAVFFEMVGERGRAYTDYPFGPDPDRQTLLIETAGHVKEEVFENAGDKFTLQFERFARAVNGEADPLPSMEWSIIEARTIESIHKIIGLRW